MDVDLGAVAQASGPFAQFLIAAAIVSGIAAWVGRQANGTVESATGAVELLKGAMDQQQEHLTEAWRERDAARQDSAQQRADAEAARAEARRLREELEMAQADRRRAETMLADSTFRLRTVEAAMHELELQHGVPHRRSVDGADGSGR